MENNQSESLVKSVLSKLFSKRAVCDSSSTVSTIDYTSVVGTVRRANVDNLREVFLKYATHEHKGEPYMSDDDFVRNYLGMYQESNYNRESVKLIASAADTTKDGYISFDEFQVGIYLYVFKTKMKTFFRKISFVTFRLLKQYYAVLMLFTSPLSKCSTRTLRSR